MNRLAEIGRAAMRAALLKELETCGWNLQHAGERLGLGGTQGVCREIVRLGLTAERDAARRSGLIPRGGRRSRVSL